jgi:hypothetical protein
MSKLLAAIVSAIVAVMFSFGTTTVFAADKGATKDAPKVDCKDKKNKDNDACTPATTKKNKGKNKSKGTSTN